MVALPKLGHRVEGSSPASGETISKPEQSFIAHSLSYKTAIREKLLTVQEIVSHLCIQLVTMDRKGTF